MQIVLATPLRLYYITYVSFDLTAPPDPPQPDPTADLLRRVGLILFGLTGLVARAFWNTRHTGLFWPLWTRLGNAKKRIDRIAAHLAAGTWPRPRRPGQNRALQPSRSGPPPVHFPGGRGWLVKILAHHGAYYTVQFENLLHEPFTIAFLAANPAVTSILRPIWRMLAVHPSLLPKRPPRRPRITAPGPTPALPLPPSAAPPPPPRRPHLLRQHPGPALDAITLAPKHLAKPTKPAKRP